MFVHGYDCKEEIFFSFNKQSNKKNIIFDSKQTKANFCCCANALQWKHLQIPMCFLEISEILLWFCDCHGNAASAFLCVFANSRRSSSIRALALASAPCHHVRECELYQSWAKIPVRWANTPSWQSPRGRRWWRRTGWQWRRRDLRRRQRRRRHHQRDWFECASSFFKNTHAAVPEERCGSGVEKLEPSWDQPRLGSQMVVKRVNKEKTKMYNILVQPQHLPLFLSFFVFKSASKIGNPPPSCNPIRYKQGQVTADLCGRKKCQQTI